MCESFSFLHLGPSASTKMHALEIQATGAMQARKEQRYIDIDIDIDIGIFLGIEISI